MKQHEPRWARFARAAVGEPQAVSHHLLRNHVREFCGALRERMKQANAVREQSLQAERPDIRLLPAAIASWGAALVAINVPADAGTTLALGGAALLGCVVLGASCARFPAAAPTLILAVLCLAAVLLSVGLRQWSASSSPLALAAAQGQALVLTLEVDTAPRQAQVKNGNERFVLNATVVQATAQGKALSGRFAVRMIADAAWAQVQAGDKIITAGSIGQSAGPSAAGGVLRPATIPHTVSSANGAHHAVSTVRGAWVGAVQHAWGGVNNDVAGLLPGMVMGERDKMAPALADSMKTVGLTHLTAVSGANCTLILASLLLLLRTARAPRFIACAGSLAGLGLFVVVVGPDPSVLRAALMGALGAMALLSGRPKRVGALLSVTVVTLLLVDPWLAADYAFILSVLATLGLHVVGRQCVVWLSTLVPLWLAQAVAIPLAAQLFCAPVIVLLQARLTPYTIVANMLAAVVVVLVTTVGTLGLALAVMLPPLGIVCAAVAGAGAWWISVVARFLAGWPGASLPWPAGVPGVVLMAALNAGVLGLLLAVVRPPRVVRLATSVSSCVPLRWRQHGLGLSALLGAAAAAWWSAALLGTGTGWE